MLKNSLSMNLSRVLLPQRPVRRRLPELLRSQSINKSLPGTGQSPIALLRFAFLRLRDPTMLSRAHAALLEVLSPFPQLENIVQVAIPSYTGELTSEVRQQLKKSLSMHLFGWDAVFSQRMKLTVAYFCQVRAFCVITALFLELRLQRHCEEPQVEESLVKVSNCLFSSIWQHCLRTIIRHIGAVVQLLTRVCICSSQGLFP